ncbi:hypothetical protein [Treponema brennaborense]|uniref:Uncharacterized protein n=1 Tax=Treponema brennaborense (strain DSM 12168 / CIP 105900 / DD5/3) TaxID=906968 RepID=F4LKC2_TREBD|nr:hypothetical protein [Treponema brennaborense]AEE16496.1 hypothetical protein Trebr_1064 [Treponema brennaborense DSM 12168]
MKMFLEEGLYQVYYVFGSPASLETSFRPVSKLGKQGRVAELRRQKIAKENHEFRLQMHKDEVIAQQGEPDTIEYSTYYPSGKDEYNIVQTVYDSGIEFTYRKGFPEIIGIRITTQNYWISADKLSPHNSTVEDVFNCYGTMPYRTSIERNNDNFELHLTYQNDAKLSAYLKKTICRISTLVCVFTEERLYAPSISPPA